VTIRILLVDDERLLRTGFSMILRSEPDLAVVGEAADGHEAVTATAELHPDVILMDIRMPGLDGLEATRRIVASGSSARILVLTTFDLDTYVYAALAAGASGFLLKDTLPDELLAAVRVVASGQALLAPSVTRRLLEEFATRPTPGAAAPAPWLATLTAREQEVLVAVARGLSNTEVAETLFMSPATAKTHVSRLLSKLHARDRAQLVVLAYEAGIVSPGVA
jgi:DNA-binding NarL/FixJ family response regulator